jgi:hypothetical protein
VPSGLQTEACRNLPKDFCNGPTVNVRQQRETITGKQGSATTRTDEASRPISIVESESIGATASRARSMTPGQKALSDAQCRKNLAPSTAGCFPDQSKLRPGLGSDQITHARSSAKIAARVASQPDAARWVGYKPNLGAPRE